jgi:hypothetical protein
MRILFLNHSFCFHALLSHQLRPGQLTASYKCTSFGGLRHGTSSIRHCVISNRNENKVLRHLALEGWLGWQTHSGWYDMVASFSCAKYCGRCGVKPYLYWKNAVNC